MYVRTPRFLRQGCGTSFKQESPPAWTQGAYRLSRSKYTLCCSGRGYPLPPSWDLTWIGRVPHPVPSPCPGIWPGWGGTPPRALPPSWDLTWMGGDPTPLRMRAVTKKATDALGQTYLQIPTLLGIFFPASEIVTRGLSFITWSSFSSKN